MEECLRLHYVVEEFGVALRLRGVFIFEHASGLRPASRTGSPRFCDHALWWRCSGCGGVPCAAWGFHWHHRGFGEGTRTSSKGGGSRWCPRGRHNRVQNWVQNFVLRVVARLANHNAIFQGRPIASAGVSRPSKMICLIWLGHPGTPECAVHHLQRTSPAAMQLSLKQSKTASKPR